MKLQYLAPLAAASLAAAQDNGDRSLTDALGSQDDLSSLVELLDGQSDLVDMLTNMSDITILAPSNDALQDLLSNDDIASMIREDPGIVTALLSYHVLNGTYYASNVTDTPAFIPTLLNNSTYSNVTNGQVVEALSEGDTVSFYSGLRKQSNVSEANLNFTGGTIHVINEVLDIPMNISGTALAAGLTAVVGSLTAADLASAVDGMENITVFAPNNDAFAAIGSVVGDLSTDQLSDILQYHVVPDMVAYSSDLMNGTVETAEGGELRISIEDGMVYVNEAQVVIPNVLVANGVVHVIDGVLNPNNTAEATPNPSTTTPAFSGASSATDGEIPFTSGVPSVTESATGLVEATGGAGGGGGSGGDDDDGGAQSTDSEEAGPRATAAVAMGALFGGAAIMLNNF